MVHYGINRDRRRNTFLSSDSHDASSSDKLWYVIPSEPANASCNGVTRFGRAPLAAANITLAGVAPIGRWSAGTPRQICARRI
jgi:hypothetical protein